VTSTFVTTAYAETMNGDDISKSFTTLTLQPVRTGSPRETLETFQQLSQELENLLLAYQENQNITTSRRIKLVRSQFIQLLDLSSVPKASSHEVGIETIAALLDIIGRIDLPPIESVPDHKIFDVEDTVAKWRIPHTPIKIVRIEDGPREGEFLFSERTITVAQNFYQRIKHLPLRSSLEIESWQNAVLQIHGPMIPAGLVASLPDSLKVIWLDTPIWKILMTVILIAIATFLLVLWHRMLNLFALKDRIAIQLRDALTPLAIILVILVLIPFIGIEVNVAGNFAQTINFTLTLVMYLAATWIAWLLILAFFEWVILSPRIPDESLDANLLRMSARIIGFVTCVLILAHGAQDLGLPVFGLIASLGIGGIAVALAIRPTLENLIGGAVLYMDKPVRVGDFCTFGDFTGNVESIGVRSTQVRARDRTLITIPNAIFADMQIINWAKCDRMMIQTMIGLRYETEPDQMRYVLAQLREMLHAHPKIESKTVRVRFAAYGASSLDVEIRVYALTREWNEFYAIREDVFLRVNNIIKKSGTSFAFPSQTLYMSKDDGLDKELSDAAVEKVENWRKTGRLPFPVMTSSRIEELADTLDYPPYGSPHAESQESEEAELLSAEPEEEKKDSIEQESQSDRRDS